MWRWAGFTGFFSQLLRDGLGCSKGVSLMTRIFHRRHRKMYWKCWQARAAGNHNCPKHISGIYFTCFAANAAGCSQPPLVTSAINGTFCLLLLIVGRLITVMSYICGCLSGSCFCCQAFYHLFRVMSSGSFFVKPSPFVPSSRCFYSQ